MNRADRRAVDAVGRAAPAIGRAIELIVRALSRGGRLVFVGAGTSGRLGVIEAAECPPTFDTPPALVQAVIAGGRGAVSAPWRAPRTTGRPARVRCGGRAPATSSWGSPRAG